jgi:cephalosporin-C deacetylase-like acetyl esterase
MISVESKNVITSVLSFYSNKKKIKKQDLLISMQLEGEYKFNKMVNKAQRKKMWCVNVRTLTKAPITPRLVRRKYSKGRVLLVVFKKGYRKRGMWAVCLCRGRCGYVNK